MIKLVIKSRHLLHDRGYRGAEFCLPADKSMILDALDIARVPYGSGEYQLIPHRDSPKFVLKMLDNSDHNPSLTEMNHLAERLEGLTGDDMCKLDAILEIRNSYSITDAINATHNLHRFVQHPVFSDAELGEIAIESGGMYEPLEQVPDELLLCLDPTKIGALVQKQDGGVFTKSGYVFAESDGWDEVYNGQSLACHAVTLEESDSVISLLLSTGEFSFDESDSEWLHCPADEKEISNVLKSIGAKTLDGCSIHEVRSVIPALGQIALCADITKINALAGQVKSCGGAQFAKYKALLDLGEVSAIDAAIDLTGRLDEYDFTPGMTPESFGRQELEKNGIDLAAAEESGVNFATYGYKSMETWNILSTPYGFISHPRGQEPVMEMAAPKPDIPIEPALNM